MTVTNIKSDKPKVERIRGITLKYIDCNSRPMHDALDKLDAYSGFSLEDFHRFMKIKNKFDHVSKQVQVLFQKLIRKHAEHEEVLQKDKKTGEMVKAKDKRGNQLMRPVIQPGPSGANFKYIDQLEFEKEYHKLMSTEFRIETYQLLTEDLIKAGLTPKEIRACAMIISDIDPELKVHAPIFETDEDPEEDNGLEAETEPLEASIPEVNLGHTQPTGSSPVL